ncbi:MAG: bifunctional hydroxymethylpyrimidine kinase/phosphomethylpyrimidine kinase [Alphaproteobacteria bacterium]|nr:bifunctional hydroxymethylpyrimidine kinase/phosphomethylpyrimidine kinase [Alphaproteobacteria bacterium]
MSHPTALTIAGSDSGGGAGIQADLKTFSALGVYGCSVIAALTAQNTQAVTGVMDIPPDFITKQIDAVFSDIDVHAVKIGMLSVPETIEAVADGLKRHNAHNIVLDPVMVAKSGDALLQPYAVAAVRDMLLPMADLITPNLPEAETLLGREPITDASEMQSVGGALLALGPKAVLLKGGHLKGDQSPDLLIDADGAEVLHSRRIDTRNTHGTGCTLSSAIAAGLAQGLQTHRAVGDAKDYIQAAIGAADSLDIGRGHGPVHHFHRVWN